MNNEQLKQKMLEFLDHQDNITEEEWFGTDRYNSEIALYRFAKFLGIVLIEDYE